MISIIYPVYNVEAYIDKSLQSLLNQDFTDFEVIAVNDGSTDGSLTILEKYAADDDRIKIYSQENQGVAKARMNALKYAGGEYVCFVDSDDILPKDSLSILYNALIDNDVDIAEGNYCKVFQDGSITDNVFPESKVISAKDNIDLLISSKVLFSLWAKIYKKNLFSDVVLKDFNFMEDVCLLIQTATRADKVALVNENVYHYVQRKGSVVHSHFFDESTADYYVARLWIADYLEKLYSNYFKNSMEIFILQGFAYTICLGGKRFLKKKDISDCKKIFTYHKKCLPIGQRIVVQTVGVPVVSFFSTMLYQIRIRFSRR